MTPPNGAKGERGGTLAGVLITVLVLVVIAVGAFFYFGGRANVTVKPPDVSVSATPNPGGVSATVSPTP